MPTPEELARWIQGDQVEPVRRALDAEPDLLESPGEEDRTPLHWAAEFDAAEVATLLLDRGANLEAVTSWDNTPLDWAAALGSLRVGKLLLARGAQGLNLVSAAGLGLLDRVREMLDATKPPRGRRPATVTPTDHWPTNSAYVRGDLLGDALVLACRNGHTDVARLLHERGADLRARGVFGGTALHWAAHRGHEDTVEFLLDLGLDPKDRDPHFDADAAGWAREGGHMALADLLRGAD